jgi:hypothetical protein
MDRDRTQDEHWDRDQVQRDVDDEVPAADQGEVWNRQQMEFDNSGTEREGTGREAMPDDVTGTTDTGTADMDHISGRGMPSGGEGHFERNDPTE